MKKELIICIVIIFAIIIGNIVTQNYTVKSVEEIANTLEELKEKGATIEKNKAEDIESEENKKVEEKLKEVQENWNNRKEKLAYYIEHDELEKVDNYLTGLNSFIATGEYDEAICELDKAVFVLKHIEDKYAFNLVNIF